MLLHLGHLGSSSDSITNMRHLGHPTSTMDVASGLLEYLPSSSDDTHELGGVVGDTVADRLGVAACGLRLGGDKLSFKSSFGPFLLLICVFFFFQILPFYTTFKTLTCLDMEHTKWKEKSVKL